MTRRTPIRAARRRLPVLAAAGIAALTVVAAAPSGGATYHNYAQYLQDLDNDSYNQWAPAITTSNASSVHLAWTFTPPVTAGQSGAMYSSPTVYKGHVYIGSDNGNLYSLNETNGSVIWTHSFGTQPSIGCPSHGVVSTVAVIVDPATSAPEVYVTAPDGYLYALSPADGSVLWRSPVAVPSGAQNDYFDWSSPTVDRRGHIFVGVSSSCDDPPVQGGLIEYDQHTGSILARYSSVPAGNVGGSVRGATMVVPGSPGSVFVATDTAFPGNAVGDSDSLVKLNLATLAKDGGFTVPASEQTGDDGFIGSPSVFAGVVNGSKVQMVGACNKNGKFYAVKRNPTVPKLVWEYQLGSPTSSGSPACSASATNFDTSAIFLSGNSTTIGKTTFNGSIQAVDPGTGQPLWQTGLPAPVATAACLNESGVLAVGTDDMTGSPNAVYLVNASNGAILATLSTGNSPVYGQAVFADSDVFASTLGGTLFAFTP